MYKRHCGRCAWSKRTALIRFPPFFANGQRAAGRAIGKKRQRGGDGKKPRGGAKMRRPAANACQFFADRVYCKGIYPLVSAKTEAAG